MLNGKRGAVELSITTIVVVVIGIVLLTLGLIWVRGIFGRLGGTTSSAFDKVDAEITSIFGDVGEPIILSPPAIKLKRGETKTALLILSNTEGQTINNVIAQKDTANSDLATGRIDCLFADTLKDNSLSYNLGSDQQAKLTIVIKDNNAPLGVYNCVIHIPTFNVITADQTEALIIERVA